MKKNSVAGLSAWKKLEDHAGLMESNDKHLKVLLQDPQRLEKFSLTGAGIFYDFSRQRFDEKAMDLLFELAEARTLTARFEAMMRGEKVNVTENRAALHTAARDFSGNPIVVDGTDVAPMIKKVREEIELFSRQVHNGEIRGSTGKPFKHVVVIGIGGSYLGGQFVSEALKAYADKGISLHYLANVDIHNFGHIVSRIEPESTLWIVISKSYTTAETMANEAQARVYMKGRGLDPSKHFVAVTAKGSPGDDPSAPVIRAFHMFDFFGGRYSVSSAVGGLPLSLYLGYERFEAFLKGAEEIDIHTRTAPIQENIPLVAALIAVWNNNFLGYPAQGVIPYAEPLHKLAPHIQQLNMESNGKYVSADGEIMDVATGTIIFGEPGTNAQHSFFQLAHQGRPFPIDFIGAVNPQYAEYRSKSRGVTNYQELWANLIAQPMALAMGKEDTNPAKFFPGNRPSSTILVNALEPADIGRLLAFYEARTVYEAFIWGINPFDQFGVELGKILASQARKEMAAKNENPGHSFEKADAITRHYLEIMFKGLC
jgi:glucose-6-phosphate isomerase